TQRPSISCLRSSTIRTPRQSCAPAMSILRGCGVPSPLLSWPAPMTRSRSRKPCIRIRVSAASSGARSVISVQWNRTRSRVHMFADPVAGFLREQAVTRYDAAFYVSHGVPSRSVIATSATDHMTFAVPAGPDDETYQTRCQVILVNDIYTPMEFVIYLLTEI